MNLVLLKLKEKEKEFKEYLNAQKNSIQQELDSIKNKKVEIQEQFNEEVEELSNKKQKMD